MSIKRQATTDLNHDNWDQEEPSDQKDMGQFKPASKDVIEKRVIRTAKRRSQASTESTKSVFSGFGGFNKTQPSSFDFLANLTNGSKNSNGATGSNSSDTVTSSLFTNKPTTGGGGLFGAPTSTTPSKTTAPTLLSSSPFGSAVKTSPSSLFTATKADSTVKESPFKMQPVTSSGDNKFAKLPTLPSPSTTPKPFGGFGNDSKSHQISSPTNSTPFKMQPVSSTTAMVQTSFGVTTKSAVTTVTPEKQNEDKPSEKKIKYYSKLKGLNESVSDWISKHVTQTPLCILSPIFKDYDKYLKEITEEYHGVDKDESNTNTDSKAPEANTENVPDAKKPSPFGMNNTGSSFNSNPSNNSAKPSVFGAQNNLVSSANTAPPTFAFGIKTTANNASSTTTATTGFLFGTSTSSSPSATSSPFAQTAAPANQSGTAPFSFGVGKPFSFSNNNVQQPTAEKSAAENEDDEPPKVEFTPVKEDNSVYEKKCKIFVKKDGNFADKGVGTLYIKKIEESGKHQLLVRANNNLGTVLLNLVLASAIPTQRMGKNNVMLVCFPTPDSKPPPTPVLIRLKTGEEADEVLKTLDKYKA